MIVLHWSLQAYICSLWPQLGPTFPKQPFTFKELVSKTLITLLLLNQLQVKVYWIKAMLVALSSHLVQYVPRPAKLLQFSFFNTVVLSLDKILARKPRPCKRIFLKTLIIPLNIIVTY